MNTKEILRKSLNEVRRIPLRNDANDEAGFKVMGRVVIKLMAKAHYSGNSPSGGSWYMIDEAHVDSKQFWGNNKSIKMWDDDESYLDLSDANNKFVQLLLSFGPNIAKKSIGDRSNHYSCTNTSGSVVVIRTHTESNIAVRMVIQFDTPYMDVAFYEWLKKNKATASGSMKFAPSITV